MSSSPPDVAPRPVRTTYLEATDPAMIRPARHPGEGVSLVRAFHPSPELSRYLYTAIGGDWHWRDRLPWTYDHWLAHLSQPGIETWYPTVDGTPAGWFELDATRPPDVEIAFFGLLPAFVGRGLGGWLLEIALRRGLVLGTRVWVSTCTLDAPAALANYRARGLVIFRTTEATIELPDRLTGPWPGAR